jgi:glucose/mannose-6-phosphate isomerase
MLDDLKLIHERDAQDALGVSGRQWQYLLEQFDVEVSAHDVDNVVLAGMGGSALPGVLLNSWPQLTVPFEIVRGYSIPAYVGPATLFISSSFSGNTEETLSALSEAEQAGAQIVVVASGGKLADIAKEKNYPLFMLPAGIQPRMATLYFLNVFVRILAPLGLTKMDTGGIAAAAEWLKEQLEKLSAVVPTADNVAKQIALEIIGKTPIIYSGPLLFPAANKWKICMNENAKNTAWSGRYPEFNHNEFIGWSSHPVDKPFAVVEIRSNLEHKRVQKRFVVSERLLSGKRPAPIVVEPHGETLLQQLLWGVAMGDFVGCYVAILNGVNPTPVDLVEKLKVALDE